MNTMIAHVGIALGAPGTASGPVLEPGPGSRTVNAHRSQVVP